MVIAKIENNLYIKNAIRDFLWDKQRMYQSRKTKGHIRKSGTKYLPVRQLASSYLDGRRTQAGRKTGTILTHGLLQENDILRDGLWRIEL